MSVPPPSEAAVFLAPARAGDDARAGTIDAPVATLARAQALGRQTIFVAGGRYFLEHDPLQPLPAPLVAEVRAFLREHGP